MAARAFFRNSTLVLVVALAAAVPALLMVVTCASATSVSPPSFSVSASARLVPECCNPANTRARDPNEKPCIDTSDRETRVCLKYSCLQKTIRSMRTLQNGTRTDPDLAPMFTFASCQALPFGAAVNGTPPKAIMRLDVTFNGTLIYKQTKSRNTAASDGEDVTAHILSWPSDSYCVNTELGSAGSSRFGRVYDDETRELRICMDISQLPNIDDDDPTLIIIYLIFTSFAAMILLITMCCFIMSYEKQSIHGWTQFTHVLAFFLLMVFWDLDDSFIWAKSTGTPACKAIAVGSQFFYIALFSWLLVVNFDLRQAFDNFGRKEFRPRVSSVNRYLAYSAFGWGVPLLVVAITIACSIAFDTTDEDKETIYMPLYGIKGCSLAFQSYWLFLTLPNGILLVLVFVLFVKMVRILRRQRRSSRSGTTAVLGTKILFLMGPFWFLDLITCIHVAITKDEFVWYITLFDMIVILQAIPLFIIYICRPDLLEFLQEKYPRLRNVFIGVGKLFCVPRPPDASQSTNSMEMGESMNAKLRINRRPSMPPTTFASRSVRGVTKV